MEELKSRFREKLGRYAKPAEAQEWFGRNSARIQTALEDGWVRDFIFEPIKDVFVVKGATPAHEIRATITRVAVVNAVLAGLPGKMGVGVFVSMALEAWMAYGIARRVGVEVREPTDIFKYFTLLAGVGVTIIWLFKELLGVLFSLFSPIPGLNPLIPAELVATNLIGVLFWIGFEEAARQGSFRVPTRAVLHAGRETRDLYRFQWSILDRALSPQNLARMGQRFLTWLRGEIPVGNAAMRGELFPTVAMAWLLTDKFERLQGPLGTEFVGAIRDRFPELADASIADISAHMGEYDAEQMAGVINLVKGKLFERLVVRFENADGDEWQAHLHDDESYPGSDMVLTNEETGEQLEVSLKASLNPDYIEGAWQQYPNIPVAGPDELAAVFADHPGFVASGVSHAETLTVTHENFERLLGELAPSEAAEVAGAGVAAGAAFGLWPFVVAYLRGRISYEQMAEAFERVFGEAGRAMASRVSYAIVLGPVFAWYLLARGVMGVVRAGETIETPPRRLTYVGPVSIGRSITEG